MLLKDAVLFGADDDDIVGAGIGAIAAADDNEDVVDFINCSLSVSIKR